MYFTKSKREISLEESNLKLREIKHQVEDLMFLLGDDCENIKIDWKDTDQFFLKEQHKHMLDKLTDFYYLLSYLSLPVIEQGYVKAEGNYYQIKNSSTRLQLGDKCEILYDNPSTDKQNWVLTRILHKDQSYFAEAIGENVSLEGLFVRIRGYS